MHRYCSGLPLTLAYPCDFPIRARYNFDSSESVPSFLPSFQCGYAYGIRQRLLRDIWTVRIVFLLEVDGRRIPMARSSIEAPQKTYHLEIREPCVYRPADYYQYSI